MQDLPLAKTTYGLASLDKLVGGFRYVESIVDKNGSRLAKEGGELFCAFDGVGPKAWVGARMNRALVCTPAVEMPRFATFGRGYVGEAGPGSIRVVTWKAQGVALVIATSPIHIGDIWLGFVPLAEVDALKVPQ